MDICYQGKTLNPYVVIITPEETTIHSTFLFPSFWFHSPLFIINPYLLATANREITATDIH